MALVSRDGVRRELRGLPAERFAAFVSALWAARGAETAVTADGCIEARHGGRVERFRPVTGRRVPDSVDGGVVLVLSRPASAVRGTERHEGRVVDADDLRAMLLYAVPRETGDDLCRRFFDRPLVTDDPPPAPSPTARLPEYSAPLVVGLLGVVLVVAGVVGTPALFATGASTAETGGGGPSGVEGTPTVERPNTDQGASPTPSRAERSVAGESRYPPGLGHDGVVDENALADAHAKAVTGRSYRLTITQREFVDGRPSAYRHETVTVASRSRYRTELEGAGELRHDGLVVSDVEAFADGRQRYARRDVADEFNQSYTVDVGPLRAVRNGEDRYADRVERYVEWYFSVSDSELRDVVDRNGTRYYWVELGRDPYPAVENASGSALVDEHGVVHQVWRRYNVPGEPSLLVVVTVQYTDFGNVSVSPPAWYDAGSTASNGSDGTEAPTRTPTPTSAGTANRSTPGTPASGPTGE